MAPWMGSKRRAHWRSNRKWSEEDNPLTSDDNPPKMAKPKVVEQPTMVTVLVDPIVVPPRVLPKEPAPKEEPKRFPVVVVPRVSAPTKPLVKPTTSPMKRKACARPLPTPSRKQKREDPSPVTLTPGAYVLQGLKVAMPVAKTKGRKPLEID